MTPPIQTPKYGKSSAGQRHERIDRRRSRPSVTNPERHSKLDLPFRNMLGARIMTMKSVSAGE
jgi:hypothetical protein